MEDLIKLKGIEKVKTSMVELFEMTIFLNNQDPETRKANTGSYNFCLLGNPVSKFDWGNISRAHELLFWVLLVISCAQKLIKSPPRERNGENCWSFMPYKMLKTSLINKVDGANRVSLKIHVSSRIQQSWHMLRALKCMKRIFAVVSHLVMCISYTLTVTVAYFLLGHRQIFNCNFNRWNSQRQRNSVNRSDRNFTSKIKRNGGRKIPRDCEFCNGWSYFHRRGL